MGFWNIIPIFFPRYWHMADSFSFNRSVPSNRMEPDVMTPGGFGTRPMTDRAVVVLPAPVSPTSPTVFPLGTSNDIWLIAFTTPSYVRNSMLKSFISSRFSLISFSPFSGPLTITGQPHKSFRLKPVSFLPDNMAMLPMCGFL